MCDAVGVVEHGGAQGFEQRLFDLKRATAGVQDARFKLGQVNGRETNGVRGGLAMDKGFVQGGRQHLVRMGGGAFDKIAQDVVMFDL